MFEGGLWKSCGTLLVWQSYGNCLYQKVGPSWEVRLAGIGLHLAAKVSLTIATIGLCWCMPRKKKGRFWSEAGAGYLPSGSNKVKVWRRWSRLLVDCCGWELILGSACVEICRGWAQWESGVRCVGSWGRNMTAREPPWKQNGLPSTVNIKQIVLAKSHSLRVAYHQPGFIGSWLTFSPTCLPCLPSRQVRPCVSMV